MLCPRALTSSRRLLPVAHLQQKWVIFWSDSFLCLVSVGVNAGPEMQLGFGKREGARLGQGPLGAGDSRHRSRPPPGAPESGPKTGHLVAVLRPPLCQPSPGLPDRCTVPTYGSGALHSLPAPP